MSTLNTEGMLIGDKISLKRYPTIEHGNLARVNAVVVHQTDAPSAQHTFNAYDNGGNGAHFLIGKNGQIYQTASTQKRCYHVGRLIKSKCLTLDKNSCDSAEMAKILAKSWSNQIKALDAHERQKSYPERYPVNSDALGIEIVGKHVNDTNYEAVTPAQNESLQWLLAELYKHFSLTNTDVYRHPEVSYKNPGEAKGASW
ncbi:MULTISPECIES: peptidoglycan recognition protein family protein [unclassified Arsukibacterium]|uniref:peptidoglycan recognition protein family protein n=1 Tax=unclassified Arsukibacterium TaxID=2635278 RepID=UPI000C4517C7|nr:MULTISPECIES: peptidoglycan recognition family protein [unclassified Arsukibacterium]MAA94639.1 N-acetylmuramoyl-L-alanine amidase [Rheinheimera sp.]MBM32777.1 N-acetylmuramoyl-L-alanine amidase [Rheinheimera sp.]HAW93401.1 N-acetylmuramoyl-L-alanine amidase [Candidatus Azambacteria bacterium]|tara:strand:+ start:24489 stop:25088 length:600 start_codon:yes stop_codon:yes gene_type:complete